MSIFFLFCVSIKGPVHLLAGTSNLIEVDFECCITQLEASLLDLNFDFWHGSFTEAVHEIGLLHFSFLDSSKN